MCTWQLVRKRSKNITQSVCKRIRFQLAVPLKRRQFVGAATTLCKGSLRSCQRHEERCNHAGWQRTQRHLPHAVPIPDTPERISSVSNFIDRWTSLQFGPQQADLTSRASFGNGCLTCGSTICSAEFAREARAEAHWEWDAHQPDWSCFAIGVGRSNACNTSVQQQVPRWWRAAEVLVLAKLWLDGLSLGHVAFVVFFWIVVDFGRQRYALWSCQNMLRGSCHQNRSGYSTSELYWFLERSGLTLCLSIRWKTEILGLIPEEDIPSLEWCSGCFSPKANLLLASKMSGSPRRK